MQESCTSFLNKNCNSTTPHTQHTQNTPHDLYRLSIRGVSYSKQLMTTNTQQALEKALVNDPELHNSNNGPNKELYSTSNGCIRCPATINQAHILICYTQQCKQPYQGFQTNLTVTSQTQGSYEFRIKVQDFNGLIEEILEFGATSHC